jgi:hypothetical protein
MRARAAQDGLSGVTASPVATGTPTVGWQATAQAAQATADEARRVNAAATAEHERYLGIAIEGTKSANELELARVWQTATFAPTSIPLTATAQANHDQQILAEQRLIYTKITQTAEAPRRLIEMKVAEVYDARVDFYLRMFAYGAVGFFLIAIPLVFFVAKRTPPVIIREVEKPAPMMMVNQGETVIHLRDENDGFVSMRRVVAPCSAGMLTEFAEGIISGDKTTSYEYWARVPWSHKKYSAFRAWLTDKKINYAILSDSTGEITINEDGKKFLRGWLETRQLPAQMDFGLEDDDAELPVIIPSATDKLTAVNS